MAYINEIFEKATVRGFADYLLFGLKPKEEYRDYEERLEEPYKRFEKILAQYDKEEYSELLDLSNEITSETASVYMEIGLQVGVLLMKDMYKNICMGKATDSPIMEMKKEDSENMIIDTLYKERIEKKLQEALKMDKEYQKVNDETKWKIREIDNIGLDKMAWDIIDNALTATNERSSEYGRVAYRQGFMDAIQLLKK